MPLAAIGKAEPGGTYDADTMMEWEREHLSRARPVPKVTRTGAERQAARYAAMRIKQERHLLRPTKPLFTSSSSPAPPLPSSGTGGTAAAAATANMLEVRDDRAPRVRISSLSETRRKHCAHNMLEVRVDVARQRLTGSE